jgi:hypothetical protein
VDDSGSSAPERSAKLEPSLIAIYGDVRRACTIHICAGSGDCLAGDVGSRQTRLGLGQCTALSFSEADMPTSTSSTLYCLKPHLQSQSTTITMFRKVETRLPEL